MEPSGQLPLEITFENRRLEQVGVQVISFKEFRQFAPPSLVAQPLRADFFHLILVSSGRGSHMVDFTKHALRAGSLVMILPGQVHQWHLKTAFDGLVALITTEALDSHALPFRKGQSLLKLRDWPQAPSLGREVLPEILADMQRLDADIRAFKGIEYEAEIIRQELMTLLLRLAKEVGKGIEAHASTREQEVFGLFESELDAGFAKRLSVLDYATRIGFSESTLSRACVAVMGHTAKQVIDQRVTLEAKRLLVHSEASVAFIGHQLGFSEPTNFVKFFKRGMAGQTPLEFRALYRPL